MNEELRKRLERHAYKITVGFCYGCHRKCPAGRCFECYSDDLMRHLEGVGCEYGIEWVIDSIIEDNCTAIKEEEEYEQYLEGAYPDTTQVGWMNLDTISVMQQMDPYSFESARQEHFDEMVNEGEIVEVNGKYFKVAEIESYLDLIEGSVQEVGT